MKLLFENWRKYINEAGEGFDLAKKRPPKTKWDPLHPSVDKPWKESSIEYTAFFLDPGHEGTLKLKEMVPDEWKEHADHMTIIPPNEVGPRLPTEQFGEGCVKVVAVAQNDKVIAGKVEMEDKFILYSKNDIPHITIATAVDPKRTSDPEKPVYYSPSLSNEFTEEHFKAPEGFEPIDICGKVEEVPR